MALLGAMPRPDVVYIVRPGEQNEELRHSLRSIACNLAGRRRVWIVGYTPSWVRNVHSVPTEQSQDKQLNALRNLWTALEHPDISDPFYLFNDDFYVMAPMDEIGVYHRGPVTRVIAEHIRDSLYRRSMRDTSRLLRSLGVSDPLSYELHIPMPVGKEGMATALELGANIYGVHNRTLYGNLAGIGGEYMPDPKVYTGRDPYRNLPFLSTNDNGFRQLMAGQYVRTVFAEPSKYENVDVIQRHTSQFERGIPATVLRRSPTGAHRYARHRLVRRLPGAH